MPDRFYEKVKSGVLGRHNLYFVFQSTVPKKLMLEAGEYTIKRFAALYGTTYCGVATNNGKAANLDRTL